MQRIDEILQDESGPIPALATVNDSANVVELDSVSISFGRVPVLHDVSFSVAKGETVALVGPTGSGKSTLLSVIAGLLPADSGTVAAPTVGTRIVFQEPFLFDGSIRDNLLLGDSVSDRLDLALRLSCADEFVEQLPAGVETLTGERGVGLSGGQRQRLALARALIRQHELLLLDDTTSALDSNNEQRVLQHLRSVSPRPAVLMAASRPSAIRAADRIIFLNKGRVEGIGTHEQLVRELNEYRELVTSYETGRNHG